MLPDSSDDNGAVEKPDTNDVISRLYDVALDPGRYEALLDQWESVVGPVRRTAHDRMAQVLDDPTIAEHFNRAGAFLDNLKTNDNEISQMLAGFDKVAALLISRDMKVLDLNSAARQSLGINVNDKLSALPIDEQDRVALANQVAKMLADGSPAPSVFRVRSADHGQIIVFHMRLCTFQSAPPVVTVVTSHLRWPDNFSEMLSSAFELTAAETDVVRALIDCASVREIAERRGRAIDTVRAQVKSILAKTETNSQIELVRLVLSMMDIAGFTGETDQSPKLVSQGYGTLQPIDFQSVYQNDGRRTDYISFGDPRGRACLFLPMDYGLIRWPASAEHAAAQANIRVIVPIRGGYGASDPIPRNHDFAQQVAQDILTILETEKVTQCPIISLGSDFHFAAQLHRERPGLVSAILASSGVLPLSRPEQYERMDKWHRFILASARYTPKLLPFMVKAGFHLARKGGKSAFVQSVFGKSQADLQTFENPEVFEAMLTGSEVALSDRHSAHDAFAAQAIYQQRNDWRDVVYDLQDAVPVHFFSGQQDPEIHRDTLDEFQQDYPWIDFNIYPDAGQLLFFRHWPDLLKKVQEYL